MSKLKKYIRHSKTASRLEKGFLVDHSTLLSREMCFSVLRVLAFIYYVLR